MEEQGHECGSGSLSQQSRRSEHAACTSASVRRCRAYHDAVVRRLEEPESEPAEDEAPDDIYFVGLGRKPGEQKEPAGHDGESDASQQSCMYAFDEYACERCYDHDDGRARPS